ncbi:hypothetical protein K9N68_29215 [Kovacikia minuta CCNUW1]|uniref:hypothetical protein n=1 Tax=Kovacikia minuta TaxID=2931930 RepID=UPI001CCAC353|nr:hypothetical protein [Kovacikia minuta]UBF25604.1 hypothetical protein K9N68_29215 [Kovacikia minuta CCNUW1]
MKFFIDSKPNNPWQAETVQYRVTDHYIEFEIPSNHYRMVLYLIPRDRASALVATCWDTVFDQEPANLNEEKTCKMIFETCPNLAHLLTNGICDRYREGALLNLEDFDAGEAKWFLTSIVDNLDFRSLEHLLNEQVHQVISQIMHQSFELLNELYEKQPAIFDIVTHRIGNTINLGFVADAVVR